MKNKPTYSKQVIEIADFIFKNPQYKTAEIIAVFCGKLRKSKRSIEGYIKYAKEYNKSRLQKQETARNEVLAAEAKEAVKSTILSRNERLEILSNIAKGSARKVENEIMMPSDSERVKAISEMNKMEGDYAPTKTEIEIDTPQQVIIHKNYK